ncbi:MAG: hypothetical protein HDQ88_05075 [Clostridia bacterium]|nr:hypothetical protein [Clostridia bacterium]
MHETRELRTQDLTIIVEHAQDEKYLAKIKQSSEKDVNEIKKIAIQAKSMDMAMDKALDEALIYFMMIRLFTTKAEHQLTELMERLRKKHG